MAAAYSACCAATRRAPPPTRGRQDGQGSVATSAVARTARRRPGPSRSRRRSAPTAHSWRLQARAAAGSPLKAGAVDARAAGLIQLDPIEVPDFSKVESAADGSVSKVPSAGSLIIVKIEELRAARRTPSTRWRVRARPAAPGPGVRQRRQASRSRSSSSTGLRPEARRDHGQGERHRGRQRLQGRQQDAARAGAAEHDRDGVRGLHGGPHPAHELRAGQVPGPAQGHGQGRQEGSPPGSVARGDAVVAQG